MERYRNICFSEQRMTSQYQPSPPMILLVEPDDVVRPILVENLHRWGYHVIVTLDAADAIQRTRNGGEPFDLILLNQSGQTIDHFVSIGQTLRQQANRSNSIPIVIMAERYGVELEGQNIQVGECEYVAYLEDGQQLRNLLHKLCPI